VRGHVKRGKGGDVRGLAINAVPGSRRKWITASIVSVALVAGLGACSDDDDGGADDAATEEGGDGGDGGGDTADANGGDDTGGDDTAGGDDAALAEAEATIAEQQATIDDLNTQLATTQADYEAAQAELAATVTRAETAEAEAVELDAQREAVLAAFPIEITSSLDDFDVIGAYTLQLTEAFCAALPTCGQQRAPIRADIVQGVNGLELQVPTVLTAGLFALEGSLFAVTGSNLIAPPCNGTPRTAQVSVTVFEDGLSIESDGTRELTGLGASLMVNVPATDQCEEGDVFFSGTLTPV
jgi:uncharacterized coiled-coil protein SlyX